MDSGDTKRCRRAFHSDKAHESLLEAFQAGGNCHSNCCSQADLLTTAVPSRFPWKKGSPVKRKAPARRSPIKRKSAANRAETTTTNANVSTCDVIVTAQDSESPVLSSTSADFEGFKQDENLQEIIHDLKVENEHSTLIELELREVTNQQEKLK